MEFFSLNFNLVLVMHKSVLAETIHTVYRCICAPARDRLGFYAENQIIAGTVVHRILPLNTAAKYNIS